MALSSVSVIAKFARLKASGYSECSASKTENGFAPRVAAARKTYRPVLGDGDEDQEGPERLAQHAGDHGKGVAENGHPGEKQGPAAVTPGTIRLPFQATPPSPGTMVCRENDDETSRGTNCILLEDIAEASHGR